MVLGTLFSARNHQIPPVPHPIVTQTDSPSVSKEGFPLSELDIVTVSGKKIHFTIELATTIPQRAQGLMFRQNLEPQSGMLFDYGVSQQAAMWMKNTLIPLDMLFMDAAGTIVFIQDRTVPMSETVIAAPVPVRAVLELAGGTTSKLGIRIGDRVEHPIFK